MPCPCPPSQEDTAATTSHSVVVAARLFDSTSGELLARYADWPQPYRHVEFPDPHLEILLRRNGSGDITQVSLSVTKPVKGVLLSAVGGTGEVTWSDNALDILPHDPQTVTAIGLGDRGVKATYMSWDM